MSSAVRVGQGTKEKFFRKKNQGRQCPKFFRGGQCPKLFRGGQCPEICSGRTMSGKLIGVDNIRKYSGRTMSKNIQGGQCPGIKGGLCP